MPGRIFLLSPAHCGGRRAELLFRDAADFDLARRLRNDAAVPIGEVFAFVSGLYFRGKLGYSTRFARPPGRQRETSAWVITTDRGLVPVDHPITLADLRAFAVQAIDPRDPAYHLPLSQSASSLAQWLPKDCEVVLLGSIATGKYVDLLLTVFGPRLLFPEQFVGRGDMSRGGLMLRAIDECRELTYVPVDGAVRHGARPPKLLRRTARTAHESQVETADRADGGAAGQ